MADLRSPADEIAEGLALLLHGYELRIAMKLVPIAAKAGAPPPDGAPSGPIPAPAGAGPEPARDRTPRDDKLPRTGKHLFAWAKDQGERNDTDLVHWVDQWAKGRPGWAPRMTAWSDALAAEAATALNRKLIDLTGGGNDQ